MLYLNNYCLNQVLTATIYGAELSDQILIKPVTFNKISRNLSTSHSESETYGEPRNQVPKECEV